MAKKCFLFDIDGTLALGDELFPGTRELLEKIHASGGQAYYITNNSTRSGADYVRRFREVFDLEVPEERFVTAGYVTLEFLKEHFADGLIYCLGTKSYVEELRRNGLHVTEECRPDLDCILVAYDSEVTYGKLCQASEALLTTEAPFYATTPYLRCPSPFGFIPDCGSICDMLTATTGRRPEYLGKPNVRIAELCLERSGFSKEETIVIGDRLYTDIACGINTGIETGVILLGEATREDLKTTEFPPDYVYETVEDIIRAWF